MDVDNRPVDKDQLTFVSVETSAYSGATLLSFLLGSHPDIATVGEMNGLIASEDPDQYLCSCGQRIRECEFWQAVKVEMRDRGFQFDVADFGTSFDLGGSKLVRRLRRGSFGSNGLDRLRDTVLCAFPIENRRLKDRVAVNEAFVESVLDVSEARIFVDTSKDFLRVKYLTRFSKFDVRVVHLIRDVRGVVASRLRRRKDRDAFRMARVWLKQNRRIQRLLKTLPEGKYQTVRYEDLCLNPLDTLKDLYNFCGANVWFDQDLEALLADFRSCTHHIVGNVMRLGSVSEIVLDERWRTLLSEAQLAVIDQAAETFRRQYGYK